MIASLLGLIIFWKPAYYLYKALYKKEPQYYGEIKAWFYQLWDLVGTKVN